MFVFVVTFCCSPPFVFASGCKDIHEPLLTMSPWGKQQCLFYSWDTESPGEWLVQGQAVEACSSARNDSQRAWGSALYPQVTSLKNRHLPAAGNNPSTLPSCLLLLILQSQFCLSSPFLLAALSCELPHLAGSTSWLPVRQLVTSFSLKLAWKSFHLCMTAAEHSVGHRTGGMPRYGLPQGKQANSQTAVSVRHRCQFCQSFTASVWAAQMSNNWQMRVTGGSTTSRNEVVTPSISIRDCTKANDGNAQSQCHQELPLWLLVMGDLGFPLKHLPLCLMGIDSSSTGLVGVTCMYTLWEATRAVHSLPILRRGPQDALPKREEASTLRNLQASSQWETVLGCLQQDVPSLAHLLAAKRREDVINGEGMSTSTGLERHTYEATSLDLELTTSSLMGAVTSWNPHPLPCCHRDELTCRRGGFSPGPWRRMIKKKQEEQGEGHNQDKQQNSTSMPES